MAKEFRLQTPTEMGRELKLYTDNKYDLYNQVKSIQKNLIRKKLKGVYDSKKAEKLVKYLMDRSSKEYTKEFGSPRQENMFRPDDRRSASHEWVKDFEDEYKNKEFSDEMYPKYAFKKTKGTFKR